MIWNLIGGWLGGITSASAVDVLPPSPLGRVFRSNAAETGTRMTRPFSGPHNTQILRPASGTGSDMLRPWKGDLQ